MGGPQAHDGAPGVAREIRANWAAAGLQVEGVSHDGTGVKVKATLPNELDVTDFCAAMYDLGATVMYKNDAVDGPTLVVTGAAFDDNDYASDDEGDTGTVGPVGAVGTARAEPAFAKLGPRAASPPRCGAVCTALRWLRALVECLVVLVVAVLVAMPELMPEVNGTALPPPPPPAPVPAPL